LEPVEDSDVVAADVAVAADEEQASAADWDEVAAAVAQDENAAA
jgi:hypothetical protein